MNFSDKIDAITKDYFFSHNLLKTAIDGECILLGTRTRNSYVVYGNIHGKDKKTIYLSDEAIDLIKGDYGLHTSVEINNAIVDFNKGVGFVIRQEGHACKFCGGNKHLYLKGTPIVKSMLIGELNGIKICDNCLKFVDPELFHANIPCTKCGKEQLYSYEFINQTDVTEKLTCKSCLKSLGYSGLEPLYKPDIFCVCCGIGLKIPSNHIVPDSVFICAGCKNDGFTLGKNMAYKIVSNTNPLFEDTVYYVIDTRTGRSEEKTYPTLLKFLYENNSS